MTITPTAEQAAAVDLFRGGKSMKIEAGAGTGKTSTLTLLAHANPMRGQYVAFNKAIVTDAGMKMPGHVTCSTAHSLAFRAKGKRMAHRLNAGRRSSMEIARLLGVDPIAVTNQVGRKVLAAGFLAGHVMQSVVRFCQTADLEPTERHVPYIEGIDMPTDDGRRTYDNNRLVAHELLPYVRRAWLDLNDVDGRLPYRHDHYLKAWQLSGPRIGADFILFDEAQDANPVMVAIVAAQTDAQLVWVGDSQQQIYEFTGAVNALAGMPADATTFLTQSFRFGDAVAEVANDLLERLGAELRLVGSPEIASVVGAVPDPDAILCRTNARAVSNVLTAQRMGRSVHLVGGGAEVVAFAKAAATLQRGEPTYHPELACFTSWGEVQDYVAHDSMGGELRLLVNLVDEFTPEVIIKALDRMTPEDRADLVVSTAHKAKGREWPSVQLADDFPDDGVASPMSDGERRLLYVGVTRARRELDVENVLALREAEDGEPTDGTAVVA